MGFHRGLKKSAFGAAVDDRARRGARHYTDAHVRSVERLRCGCHRDRALQKIGMEVIVNIIYSVSPRHTDEYFATRARQAAAIKPYRICFKDVAGLLTPDRTRTLIPLIQQNIGDVPLEFHAHCNNGMAPFNYLEAMKLGVERLHTAFRHWPTARAAVDLQRGRNAQALGYRPHVDLEAVKPVERHFTLIAKLEGHPVGAQREYDHAQYLHQVPGGMISNLRFQLSKMGMAHRMEETLEECGGCAPSSVIRSW